MAIVIMMDGLLERMTKLIAKKAIYGEILYTLTAPELSSILSLPS